MLGCCISYCHHQKNRPQHLNTIANYPRDFNSNQNQAANDRVYTDLYPSNLNNIQYPRGPYSVFHVNDAHGRFLNSNESLANNNLNSTNQNGHFINVKPYQNRKMSSDLPTYEEIIKKTKT